MVPLAFTNLAFEFSVEFDHVSSQIIFVQRNDIKSRVLLTLSPIPMIVCKTNNKSKHNTCSETCSKTCAMSKRTRVQNNVRQHYWGLVQNLYRCDVQRVQRDDRYPCQHITLAHAPGDVDMDC